MKITGAEKIPAPAEQLWDALLDPSVLVRTIPGCERLVETGEHNYDMTVTAGVAAIRGTYSGTCTLSDLKPHESLTMRLRGAGAPGTIDATVAVGFREVDGGTEVSYDADAVVGGMVGGVGQRMLTSVARRTAAEFFSNVSTALQEPRVGAAAPSQPAESAHLQPQETGRVFTAPVSAPGGADDFARGIAVGAGLVLLGVVVGRFLGRR